MLDSSELVPCASSSSDGFDQALKAVKEGRVSDALASITKMLAAEHSGRGRFKRRTQLAHLLIAAGQRKVARPLLNQISEEIEARRLEDWEEGGAIAYALELLLSSLDPSEVARKEELYLKICKLDPVRAVNCAF